MSITSRINEMSSHIEQAYDELQGLGADLTNVNKNIENISMVLDDIYDSMPQVSGEGTSLTLDDTRVGKIKSTLKGNTSQSGTPTPSYPQPVNVVSGDNEIEVCGKNLFDKNNYVDNYYISVDGSLIYQSGDFTSEFISVSTGKYIASIATNAGNLIRCAVYDKNKNFIRRELVNGGLTLPITISDNEGFVRISAYKSSLNSMQLEKGESTSTYEPYQGNTYNIDLPVENLFPLAEVDTRNGITYTKNADGTINISGTATSDVYFSAYVDFTDINLENGGVYTFSANKTISSGLEFRYEAYNGTSWVRHLIAPLDSTHQKNTTTAINLSNATRVRASIVVTSGSTVNISNIGVQVEKGSKQNNFTPYGTTPIELCKIENYQDYFYKDSGKWYLHKEIGKIVLNGTETWVYDSEFNYFRCPSYSFTDLPLEMTSANRASYMQYANNFTLNKAWSGTGSFRDTTDVSMFYPAQNAGYKILLRNVNFTTTSDFSNWLSSNNTLIYYPLATPTNTEITYQPLIDQLNLLEKAMSKDGQTNISQVNNDLPFIISASALKEWSE